MYRVVNHTPQTGKSLGELYYEKFATQYRAALQRKLKNRRTWSVGIFGHPNDKVEMKLLPGSKAETFIMHCIKRERFFRTLLYGDLSQMVYLLKIIDKWVGDDHEMRRLSDQDKLRICQQPSNQAEVSFPPCHWGDQIFPQTMFSCF